MLHIHCNFGQKTSSSIKKAFFALLVLKWLSNLEFWRPKKKDQVARIGVMGIVAKGVNISTDQFSPPKKLAPKKRDLRHFQIRDKTV